MHEKKIVFLWFGSLSGHNKAPTFLFRTQESPGCSFSTASGGFSFKSFSGFLCILFLLVLLRLLKLPEFVEQSSDQYQICTNPCQNLSPHHGNSS